MIRGSIYYYIFFTIIIITIAVVYKSEKLGHVSETNNIDIIGLIILFIPAFSGGAFINLMYYDYPIIISYNIYYKLYLIGAFIISFVVLTLILDLWERSTNFNYTFMRLSGLNLISAKLWANSRIKIGGVIENYSTNFVYTNMVNIFRRNNSINYGLNSFSNLFFIIIPLTFFILFIIYTTLFKK